MTFLSEEIHAGLMLVYKQVLSTRISHIGVTFNTGSRDEKASENGLAHLLEHMLFKGTEKHNWRHIINQIEMVGGEMNAFTTKEKTCIYASLISDQTRQALSLLADVSLHSVFPEAELEKEKKVIADEIDMYFDSPEEMILDEFFETIFPNHPLGTNIIGQKERILKYRRDELLHFARTLKKRGNMVVSYVGPVPMDTILKWCRTAFILPHDEGLSRKRKSPSGYKPFVIEKPSPHHQSHLVYGNLACSMTHPDKTATLLLANILGGPALNSILGIALREKNGLTYGVDASYNYFTDTGVFYIQWTVDRKHLKRSREIVDRELHKLAHKPLSAVQFAAYKTQLKGQLIISEESNQGLMLMMGRTFLDFGEVEPLEKVLSDIDAVTPEQLQGIASKLFDPEKMSLLVYHQEK